MFEWFADGLCRLCSGDFPEVVFVDAVLWDRPDERRHEIASIVDGRFPYKHVAPKPTVWCGPGRKTKTDYFAASNARNTGICYASQPYIFYMDDLSVMSDDWIKEASHASSNGYIVAGSYKKVLDMVVENGQLKSFTVHRNEHGKDIGLDSRWSFGSSNGIIRMDGGMLYGCSCGFPIEDLLQVNGWDEIHDSSGAEDYSLGISLQKHGKQLWFNRNLHTTEDDLAHGQGPVLKRIIKPGNPDASHVILNRLRADPKPRTYGNFFELRTMRDGILNGGSFSPATMPTHHWFDGQEISSM